MEKLSSGMRINRAGDDASGLAVSEKMRSQIRGLQRADMGAYQNRLEYAMKGLAVGAENLQASESRIRDTDMAEKIGKTLVRIGAMKPLIGHIPVPP